MTTEIDPVDTFFLQLIEAKDQELKRLQKLLERYELALEDDLAETMGYEGQLAEEDRS
tara:strand:+ start:307 stop:480 length:174 start_codon:yes stop_codon:yes gene_type:complete